MSTYTIFFQFVEVIALFALLCGLMQRAEGFVLGTAELRSCHFDGATQDCGEGGNSLVLSLALSEEQRSTTQLTLTRFRDAATGSQHAFSKPLIVEVTKSAAECKHKLVYSETFLSSAWEEARQNHKWCAAQKDESGKEIRGSAGFYCRCKWSVGEKVRGENCPWSVGDNAPVAVCARFGGIKYDGYNLEGCSPDFSIEVSVKAGNFASEKVTLSPSRQTQSLMQGNMFAELQGDFMAEKLVQDFSDKMLFVPRSPSSAERVKEKEKHAMIIPKSFVSTTGGECNKIGTSHTGFNMQTNRCQAKKNDCLLNQLDDFAKQGTFLSSRHGTLTVSSAAKSSGTQKVEFATQLADTTKSVVTLHFRHSSLEELRLLTNVASGKLSCSEIPSFHSFSEFGGTLTCLVQNTAEVAGDFELAVTCDTDLRLDHSRKKHTVEAGQEKSFEFLLSSHSYSDIQHTCTVLLLNALGQEQQRQALNFETTRPEEMKPEAGINNKGPAADYGKLGRDLTSITSKQWFLFLVFLVLFGIFCSCLCALHFQGRLSANILYLPLNKKQKRKSKKRRHGRRKKRKRTKRGTPPTRGDVSITIN